MTTWVKTLWKDSLVYGIGYGLSRFLQVIILPVITQALTLSEFGYYSNYVIFYTFTAGLFLLGLDSAVARYLYDSDDRKYHARLFSTAWFFILLLSGIAAAIISFFSYPLLHTIDVPAEYGNALPFVLAGIPFIALNNFFLSWFKWKKQKGYFLINSGGTILLLLIPLLLAHDVNFSLIFKILFWSQLSVALISTFLARQYLTFALKRSMLLMLLAYGFPWLLVFIFGVSRTYLDRVFLTQYLSDDVYGKYNFSVRISTLINLITTAFEMSFGPLAFSIWNKDGAARFFARLQSVYVFAVSALACAITIASPLIIRLLGGEKFSGAEKILPLLLFAAIPVSLINFSNLGTVYAKKSFLSTVSLFVGFAAVLLLNLLLTHVYLQYGAAISSLIGHLVIIITGYYFSRKYYAVQYSFAKDASVFFFFLIISVAAVHLNFFAGAYADMIAKAAVLAACAFLLLVLLFPKELKRLLAFLRGFRSPAPEAYSSLRRPSDAPFTGRD